MRIQTLGSAEALLQLLAAYQGGNGRRPNPGIIWSRLAKYMQTPDRGFQFLLYRTTACNPAEPPGQFFDDLNELFRIGLVRPLPDGNVEVTPFGQTIAASRALPAPLQPLEHDIASLST